VPRAGILALGAEIYRVAAVVVDSPVFFVVKAGAAAHVLPTVQERVFLLLICIVDQLVREQRAGDGGVPIIRRGVSHNKRRKSSKIDVDGTDVMVGQAAQPAACRRS